MVKIFRYNDVPVDVNIDSINNIYNEGSILHVVLKNGEQITGYNVVF